MLDFAILAYIKRTLYFAEVRLASCLARRLRTPPPRYARDAPTPTRRTPPKAMRILGNQAVDGRIFRRTSERGDAGIEYLGSGDYSTDAPHVFVELGRIKESRIVLDGGSDDVCARRRVASSRGFPGSGSARRGSRSRSKVCARTDVRPRRARRRN